jgi:xylulokinase
VKTKGYPERMEIKKYFIGLDTGSSNIKGILTDNSGSIIASATVPCEYSYPQVDMVEFNIEIFYGLICKIIKELASRVSGPITSICISGATGNTLLLDKDLLPLYPAISWMDRRQVDPIFTKEEVHPVVGWPGFDRFPLGHLTWFKQQYPDILNKTHRCCMSNDYITYRLTGNFLIDHSTATTFFLQNQTEGKWHIPFLEKLGLKKNMLSDLYPVGTEAGTLTEKASEDLGLGRDTTVVLGSFDHPAAALGSKITKESDLLLSCGTSWVGFIPMSDRNHALKQDMLIDTWKKDEGLWGGMFSFTQFGETIGKWVQVIVPKDSQKPFAVFTDYASKCSKLDCINIDLEGDFSDQVNYLVNHSVLVLARSVMESAALLLANRLKGIEKNGAEIKNIVLVGGLADNALWREIISEACGAEIKTGHSAYAGALGSALIAQGATK